MRGKSLYSGPRRARGPYVAVHSQVDLQNASADLFPGILKVARLGYDGKGQHRVATREEALTAFASMGEVNCVLEARLDLKAELSVVLARDVDGNSRVFPVARNIHHDGILAVTHVDGQDTALTMAAIDAATRLAEGLGYHGVMCVEFLCSKTMSCWSMKSPQDPTTVVTSRSTPVRPASSSNKLA